MASEIDDKDLCSVSTYEATTSEFTADTGKPMQFSSIRHERICMAAWDNVIMNFVIIFCRHHFDRVHGTRLFVRMMQIFLILIHPCLAASCCYISEVNFIRIYPDGILN